MASVCINKMAVSPENFIDISASFPSYGWLSPRISFGREMADDAAPRDAVLKKPLSPSKDNADPPEESDPEVLAADFGVFEFKLEDPVNMLPADELFSEGKLVPLHLPMIRPAVVSNATPAGTRAPDTPKSRRRTEILGNDPYLFSPKAPRCSSRWKELLGLRKLYQNSNAKLDSQKTKPSQNNNGTKSIKHFLHRSSKSSDSSLNLPLLKDLDNESISVSSRLSLSSSSSGHDHDDLPRLSLDSDNKPGKSNNNNNPPPRVRLHVKPKAVSSTDNAAVRVGRSQMRKQADPTTASATPLGLSVDSPRMNSSGKIIYHSLERSSSSPSSFNGGPRFKYRGMERSYSANVRITPVLNVPVCSLRGSSKSGGVFGFPSLFSSPQKREVGGGGGSGNGSNGGVNRSQQSSNNGSKIRTT